MDAAADVFRVYDVVDEDGYPPEWHMTIKHFVRAQAGNDARLRSLEKRRAVQRIQITGHRPMLWRRSP